MAIVKINEIRKSYGPLEVIYGLNIDIADGEFVVLVGPSGCGKSTLLRMIAGLEEISAGDIFIDERLTTLQAERHLRDAGFTRKGRKQRVDKVAAALLLQSWLEMRS